MCVALGVQDKFPHGDNEVYGMVHQKKNLLQITTFTINSD